MLSIIIITVPGGGAVPAGVNGFYPMDGSAPVGKDQFGNGNIKPFRMSSSASLDKVQEHTILISM